jgi:hypothetical protein
MKKAMTAILVTSLLACGLLSGCRGVLRGSGHLKTATYSLAGFTRVEISSAFEFEIKQSDAYAVAITADDNVIDRVEVVAESDTLKIRLRPTVSLGSVTLRAAVAMPQLYGLAASGASRGTVSDFNSARTLGLNVSGASRVTGDVTAGDVDFDVSGASTVQLEGSAENMVATVSGASRFNLGGFTVKNASVTLSGASNGTVNLTGRLDATLSGASRLYYVGEPTMGNINTSGASTLSRKQN